MRVEEQYQDVLQNIEFAITSTYRKHPEMSDYDMMRVLEAIIDAYVADKIGRSPRQLPLSDLENLLALNVQSMCDWRLGRNSLADEAVQAEIAPEPVTVDELLLCLKRIMKSIKRWNSVGGSQGYLNFVSKYVM